MPVSFLFMAHAPAGQRAVPVAVPVLAPVRPRHEMSPADR